MNESGVEIVRMDVSWEGVEKKRGIYDFKHHDRLLKDLRGNHKRLLFIISYGNPLYDNGLAPYTDEGRAAYARFCEALATHFSGKNIIWELWNEPNSDKFWPPKSNVANYVAWCKVVVPVIRKADPGACIIGPAVSDLDIPFLEEAFERGLLDLVDGISVHPYRNPKRGPETTYDEYENVKVLIDLYKPAGKNIPIISGEWGYSMFFVSPDVQGKYLARQWLSNMASAIPISIWYDWHDDGQDPKNAEFNFGTVAFNYEPKPAYSAMKNLISQLRGFHFVERLDNPDDRDYSLLFSDGKQFKMALWTTGASHEIKPEEWIPVKGVNYLGTPVQPKDNIILLNDAPVYFTVGEPVPSDFNLLETAATLSSEKCSETALAIAGMSISGNNFAASLQKMIENGTAPEQANAYLILSKLAKSIENKPASALKLYDLILNGKAPLRAKRQALYRIAVIGAEESESRIEPFLHQPEFAQAASVYYMQMAYKYAANKEFQKALDAIFMGTKATGLRYGADRALRKMKKMGWKETIDAKDMARQNGFITRWNLAGPFPNEENPESQPAHFPEKGFNPSQTEQFGDGVAKWTIVDVKNSWGIVPLAEIYGKKKRSVYAYREIEMSEDTDALFKLGTNDGAVCWVNGKNVHTNYVDRSLTVDEDVFPVRLKKGRNKLLLKVLNSGGNWEFCLRICNKEGLPLNIKE